MKPQLMIMGTSVLLVLITGIFVWPVLFPRKTQVLSPYILDLTTAKTTIEGEVIQKNANSFLVSYTSSTKAIVFTVHLSPATHFTYVPQAGQTQVSVPTFRDLQIKQHVGVVCDTDLRTLPGVDLTAQSVTLPSPVIHLQGTIQQRAGQTITIVEAVPFSDNPAVPQKREFMVTLPPYARITLQQITFGATAPITKTSQISEGGIRAGMTIDCIIQTTNPQGTVGTLLSGVVTAM